jgi:hypothetical protein
MDKKCTAFGTKLLDLCISNNLRTVNGRLGSDFNIGSYTYVTNNGAFVIDYLLTYEKNFPNICYFIVNSVNEYSDHTPVSFSLFCNNIMPVVNENVLYDINGMIIMFDKIYHWVR